MEWVGGRRRKGQGPFANLSADAHDEYLTDGLTDEVIGDLSRVRAVRVISRTSSMAFKGTRKDVKAVARELGVRYVLEGAVRRAGGKLRVTAQLIDAATDDHLWTEKYDGTLEDVFAIQERLARLIVSALQVRLSAEEDRCLADRPIANLHAYECYLQARQQAFRWRKDSIDHAVQLLRNGLAIVGKNAALHSALGRAHLQYREAGIDFSARPLRAAEACLRDALRVDPRSSAVVELRGWIHYSDGRIQAAVRDLKAALEIDANKPDTLALLANCYLISGQVSPARPLVGRLLSVDPLTPVSRCMPGFVALMEGVFAAALPPYREMFEMDPGNPMARLFYVWVLALNGRTEAAAAVAGETPVEGRDTVPARVTDFFAQALAGRGAAAAASLTPEIDPAANTTDVIPRFLAQGYALAGMPERALHWLSVAVDRGLINHPFLTRHDPLLRWLRYQPGFDRLMETVRTRWRQFEP